MPFKIDKDMLAQLMRKRGMSTAELAHAAHVSPQHVRGLVAGTREGVSEVTAQAIAVALDVPVTLVVDESGDDLPALRRLDDPERCVWVA